jgi:uncharacterized protein (TIRG00374 family)
MPGLLLGISSLLVLSFLGDIDQLGSYFSSFRWEFFALAVGLNFVHHALRFLNISFSLNISGIKHIPLKKRLTFYLSGSALTAAEQHVNESYKSLWISKTCGIPLNRVESIFFIDQQSGTLSILALAVIGIIAYPSSWPLFVVLMGVFILMLLFLQSEPADDDLMDAREKIPLMRRFSQRLRTMKAGNGKMFKPIPLSISLLLNILAWITLAVALFLILIGLGLTANFVLASISCLVLAFSIMIGFLSNMSGGMGVVELALAGLPSVLLDFRPELAVTATILFRLSTFWISLLFGILFWPTAAKSCTAEPGAVLIAES